MNKMTLTFMAIFVFAALAIDAYFGLRFGETGTISWQYANIIHEWPVIPFFVGFIMGHLNWQLRRPPP